MNVVPDNDALRTLLDARVVAWKPVRELADVEVRFMPVVNDPGVSGLCHDFLAPDEQARAGRFARAADRDEFVQRRVFQRLCGAEALGGSRSLFDIRFAHDDPGRPLLDDCPQTWFGFASCARGVLGAWSGRAAVGVDIELPGAWAASEAAALAADHFTDRERRLVSAAAGADQVRRFYRYWCLKEAALKSVGAGLPFGMDRFEFDLSGEARLVAAPRSCGGREAFQVHERNISTMYAAVVRRRLRRVRPGRAPGAATAGR
jgi:4'-phosphopantetheinyl transferase